MVSKYVVYHFRKGMGFSCSGRGLKITKSVLLIVSLKYTFTVSGILFDVKTQGAVTCKKS